MNDENIDKLITDEVLRIRIGKIFNEPKKSKWERIFSHPLSIVIVGFLLTGIIGTGLSYYINSNQLKGQEIKARKENGILAINKISEMMYQRYTAAALLASSLKRNSAVEELKERKKMYDDAYFRWNTNILIIELTVRGLTSDTVYSKIEGKIEHCLKDHFSNIDQYLTDGYDARLEKRTWQYDSTFAKNELQDCLNCSYTIINYLWIRANLYDNQKYESLQVIKDAENDLDKRCPCKEVNNEVD